MEVDQKKTGGDMKVECKLRSGGDMPTPRIKLLRLNQINLGFVRLTWVQLGLIGSSSSQVNLGLVRLI